MGSGTYSYSSHIMSNELHAYATKSTAEIFTARHINNAMSPHGVKIRESRDSAEHPNSLAIILALDETGSMGSVPHFLVKEGLPEIMKSIIDGGITDPQVLFVGIGDHECDSAPLQVGQFESSDPLLDKWLTDLFLEGGGGGNAGESYLLAWYFAAFHTAIDCFEKRGQKGFLFTVGDEPTLKSLPKSTLRRIMGDGQYSDYTAAELLDKASEKYNVYHIHVKETASGSRKEVMDGWKELMADRLLIANRRDDVAVLITQCVTGALGGDKKVASKPTEMML